MLMMTSAQKIPAFMGESTGILIGEAHPHHALVNCKLKGFEGGISQQAGGPADMIGDGLTAISRPLCCDLDHFCSLPVTELQPSLPLSNMA